MICHLQIVDAGNPVVQSQSESKRLRSRVVNGINPSPRIGENQCPSSSRQAEMEQILPTSAFGSSQAVNRLGATHIHWGGPSILLSVPIQM